MKNSLGKHIFISSKNTKTMVLLRRFHECNSNLKVYEEAEAKGLNLSVPCNT